MPMQALVSAVCSRPAVELTHTIFPGWHLNSVGFRRCSLSFCIHTKKEREPIFCFHVINLSFTFSGVFWKPCLCASGFIGVFWLSLFNLSSWAQSIPHILFCYSQRERRWSLSSAQPCVWWLPVLCHCMCHIPLSPTAAACLFSLTQDTETYTIGFTLMPILFENIKAFIFSQSLHLLFLRTRVRWTFVAF